MATLKAKHYPTLFRCRDWQVESQVWKRSRSGTPRRRRSDRPPLTHDLVDWDGQRILFSGKTDVPDGEEYDCEVHTWEDEPLAVSSERTQATLSLLDITQYPMTRRCGKSRSGDFEVIRVPRVVAISEGKHELENSWKLGEWEKLDAWAFKRTYSEAARGFVDGQDHPNPPGCSRLADSGDDPWEYL